MDPNKIYLDLGVANEYTYIYRIIEHAKKYHPEKIAFKQFESKSIISEITHGEFYDRTEALRAALYSCGYVGKHIALLGESSHEWVSTYLAITGGVGVCVPIDRELPPETMAKQIKYADVDTVFCSKRSLRKFKQVLAVCDCIKTVVVMRSDSADSLDGVGNVITMQSLIEQGKTVLSEKGKAAVPATVDPEELCVIIYTSGTTGANKGVMLTNKNIVGTLKGCGQLLRFPETTISVLPINHSYELHAHIMSCLYCGTTICINDDLKHIVKNLEIFAPEMSCMVPVMLDLIVRKLKKAITDGGKEKKFYRGVKISNMLRKIGIDKRREFFKDILTPLGGNLKFIICGGAALSQDVIDFLDNIGIAVYNGYGITECSPVAAVNAPQANRENSVGYVLPTVRVRIDSPNKEGNGEIQIIGDNVMKGYYKLPEDTAKVFTEDGWFRTGDIGHLDKDHFLYVNGRLKNLIILSNGKNIFPEEIEDSLMNHIEYIKECVVFANDENNGIYAMIYPDPEFLTEKGIGFEEIKSYMQNDINEFNSLMPGFKRLTDFEIVDKEFEKSTTHKIQRFKIAAIKK